MGDFVAASPAPVAALVGPCEVGAFLERDDRLEQRDIDERAAAAGFGFEDASERAKHGEQSRLELEDVAAILQGRTVLVAAEVEEPAERAGHDTRATPFGPWPFEAKGRH